MKSVSRRIARAVAAAAGIVALVCTSACGAPSSAQTSPTTTDASSSAQSEPIEVVASINQWGSLAEQIGGDRVSVTSILASSNVEAHDFEPQTSDVARISKAKVVVANGAGYDAWATKAVTKDIALVTAAENVGASDGDDPHLWFSKDARNAMAQELADTYAKIQPENRDYFQERLKDWQSEEQKLEQTMSEFSGTHKGATYAATESVAKYLLADLGLKDVTPKGYAQAAANESEPAPADLSEMTTLIEARQADMVINNPQETSDATNMVTGVAHKSDVPVVDVTEQMPDGQSSLTDWITALVKTFDETLAGAAEASASASADAARSGSATASPTDTPPDPGK
ncbi:periplasmic solute-binding family protein [Bifidobacterium sp. DSM 109958]|uniref:Periplasmic solute-binding family protein n=1 Tax=Bifidobacterium moraviense TaxID=2675323 RepID=A0A7Y0F024_9BIFI|nr:zinc ABC transporter substrate-binding protein [Bifidobacterium sp. DSM 109958]NMM99549.1 periplasmic solute-binding family protein [Bifidobacterium sp. DSM 109958]